MPAPATRRSPAAGAPCRGRCPDRDTEALLCPPRRRRIRDLHSAAPLPWAETAARDVRRFLRRCVGPCAQGACAFAQPPARQRRWQHRPLTQRASRRPDAPRCPAGARPYPRLPSRMRPSARRCSGRIYPSHFAAGSRCGFLTCLSDFGTRLRPWSLYTRQGPLRRSSTAP